MKMKFYVNIWFSDVILHQCHELILNRWILKFVLQVTINLLVIFLN